MLIRAKQQSVHLLPRHAGSFGNVNLSSVVVSMPSGDGIVGCFAHQLVHKCVRRVLRLTPPPLKVAPSALELVNVLILPALSLSWLRRSA